MRGRRVARRTGRRTARRTTRRVMRRRWRRRILIGGMVLLPLAGAAAVKLTQKDTQRIEQHTGASVEELSEEELVAAMRELGIKSIELDDNDRATIAAEAGQAPVGSPQPGLPEAPAEPEESYLDELERLADLRDRGIITDDDFEAKKRQLLGL